MKTIKWTGNAESISTAGDATSLALTLKPRTYRASFGYSWTGDTTGVVVPQISVDGTNWTDMADATGITDYGEAAPAGSAAGVVKTVDIAATYVRFFYDRTSGSGLLTVKVLEVT